MLFPFYFAKDVPLLNESPPTISACDKDHISLRTLNLLGSNSESPCGMSKVPLL